MSDTPRSGVPRRSSRGSEKVSADHHVHGHVALSPAMSLALMVVCAIAFFLASLVQITATEQTVFNLLQTGVQVTPQMTGEQVQQLMNGALDRNHNIATVIGWSVQIALLLLSFPADSALLSLHQRFNGSTSSSLTRSAMNYAKWRRFCSRVLIGGDVLTDFCYVAQDNIRVVLHGVWPDITGLSGGVLLVGIIYPVALCFVTVFVGRMMFVFAEALIGHYTNRTQEE